MALRIPNPMSVDTKPTLLEQIRDGTNPVAWDEFFQLYWPVVYGFARRRGCSERTAEDVIQDVMLKVFERRDVFRYDPTRGRFRDWLGTIVRHQVAEYRRRPSERARVGGQDDVGRTEVTTDESEPDEAWDAAFERAVLLALLDLVRRETEPRDFLAFELTTISEIAPAQVAAATGLSRNAVYKARRRILKRLADLAGDYGRTGTLPDRVREAMASRPPATAERAATARIRHTRGGHPWH
jgi:RNA polymerase sigma-70 factor (ECF subfamily)